MSFHRTNLGLFGSLPEMSNSFLWTKKMAYLLLTDQGWRRQRRGLPRQNKIFWKEIHDPMVAAQARCSPWSSLSSALTTVFVILHSYPATVQPLPNPSKTHHWRVFARETYKGHSKIIGTQACPLEGCQAKNEIPLHPDSISTIPSSFLCFLFHNTGDCLQEAFICGVAEIGDAKLHPPVMPLHWSLSMLTFLNRRIKLKRRSKPPSYGYKRFNI